jgi:multiple sugar transport system ATP-binding protein
MTMGDRIAVLNNGRIQQVDSPLNLFNHPANLFVAGFIGSPAMNFLKGKLTARDGAVYMDADPLVLRIPDARAEQLRDHVGRAVVFGIRPDDMYDRNLQPPVQAGDDNTAQLTVDVTEPVGSTVYAYLTAGPHVLVADLDAQTGAQDGEHLAIVFDMGKAHFFDPETELALA